MDVIGEVVIGLLIAALGGFLGRGHVTLRRELKGDIKGLDGKIEGFRQELKADINELRNEMAIMRSDITHIALAVGARPRAEGE